MTTETRTAVVTLSDNSTDIEVPVSNDTYVETNDHGALVIQGHDSVLAYFARGMWSHVVITPQT